MSRIAAKITIDELEKLVDDTQEHLPFITPEVKKDLSKVSFDMENFFYSNGSSQNCGYQTLSNGLTCLVMLAGGDWEWPVYFIVYYDGKKLRGYVPREGNPWNTDTKQAFGNDEQADHKNARKRWKNQLEYDEDDGDNIEFYVDNLDVVTSWGQIIKDIQKRIVVR